jgi:CBS domain-containing protein
MAVAQILRQKGGTVITVRSQETLAGVAGILAKNRIGAVLVIEEKDAIAGIVSERDIVRVVAEKGAAALALTARDAMTAKVRTCSPADTEADLMALMTEHRIRHVPVVDGGKIAGMISIGDVVKHRIESIEREAEELKTYIASAG